MALFIQARYCIIVLVLLCIGKALNLELILCSCYPCLKDQVVDCDEPSSLWYKVINKLIAAMQFALLHSDLRIRLPCVQRYVLEYVPFRMDHVPWYVLEYALFS